MRDLYIPACLVLGLNAGLLALNCQRSVTVISARELKVEITVKKGNLGGFARLAEYIPEGTEIKYAKSVGGTFDIQDKKLKFIWLSLPQQEEITVSYVVSTDSLKEGSYAITGKFSYVENDNVKEYELPSSSFAVNRNASLSAESLIVTYGLQLLTTKENLPPDYFAKKYQVKEVVKIDVVNGLNKYVIGEFKSPEEATAFRYNLTKKGFKDSFIVAYLNNKRISIDEARKLAGK